MDALLYYDNYCDPIPAHWYECCGCARSDTPVAGCQCICHEAGREFEDWEAEDEMAITLNAKLTGPAAVGKRRGFAEAMQHELLEHRRRIEQAKIDFGDALDALKREDPNWEDWYDDDANIPPEIAWTDRDLVDELVRRMRERARAVASQQGGNRNLES